MSGRMPSMVALLGLLAVAGYQNKDKLGGMLQRAGGGAGDADDPRNPGQPQNQGFLSELGGLFGGTSGGNTLTEGLQGLVDRFRGAGHGDAADSWVGSGSNHPLTTDNLQQALDEDTLHELEIKTSLSRQEILDRLSKSIPGRRGPVHSGRSYAERDRDGALRLSYGQTCQKWRREDLLPAFACQVVPIIL